MIKEEEWEWVFDSSKYDYNRLPVKYLYDDRPIPKPGTVPDIKPYELNQAMYEEWDRVLKKFDEYLTNHNLHCEAQFQNSDDGDHFDYCHTTVCSADDIREIFRDYEEWFLYKEDGELQAFADYGTVSDITDEDEIYTDYFQFSEIAIEEKEES